MREGDTILIADMCRSDLAALRNIRYLTYNARNLPDDARITVSESGRSFKASRRLSSLPNRSLIARTYAIPR